MVRCDDLFIPAKLVLALSLAAFDWFGRQFALFRVALQHTIIFDHLRM
jgi:hypothetical protein